MALTLQRLQRLQWFLRKFPSRIPSGRSSFYLSGKWKPLTNDLDRAGTLTQNDTDQVESILTRLAITLIRRLKTDLLAAPEPVPEDDALIDITNLDQPSRKWLAFPKTLRMS